MHMRTKSLITGQGHDKQEFVRGHRREKMAMESPVRRDPKGTKAKVEISNSYVNGAGGVRVL